MRMADSRSCTTEKSQVHYTNFYSRTYYYYEMILSEKAKIVWKTIVYKTTLDNFSPKDTVNLTQQMILMFYTNRDNCR